MAQNSLSDRRRWQRFSVNMKVFDQVTGKVIGYAMDLNIKGMKLMSMEPPAEEKHIQFWFGASAEDEKENGISLSAYRVWSSFSNTEPRYYYSGLHFMAPSESKLDSIQELIHAHSG